VTVHVAYITDFDDPAMARLAAWRRFVLLAVVAAATTTHAQCVGWRPWACWHGAADGARGALARAAG
jgi:hypothetical protein